MKSFEFTHRKIKTPLSLGEILKNVRKKKNLTLEQVEEETKVRVRYLEALEEGRYEILPSSVYAIGFLVKYAEFLGINKDNLIEKFSIERGKSYDHAKIMVERKIREPLFSITPRFILITGIVLALAGLLGYIFYNVHQFTSPPNLEISAPSIDQVIKDERVEIVGKTDTGVTLMINNQNVPTDDLGNFHQEVKLHAGLNTFEVRSINALKKESVKLVKVLTDMPAEIVPEISTPISVSPSPKVSVKISSSPKK